MEVSRQLQAPAALLPKKSAWYSLDRTRPLERPRRSWKDNIRRDLREIGWEGVKWIRFIQGRDQWRVLVNTVMNFRVPYKVVNFLTSRATVIFSSRTP
jgi:hypothetical protein